MNAVDRLKAEEAELVEMMSGKSETPSHEGEAPDPDAFAAVVNNFESSSPAELTTIEDEEDALEPENAGPVVKKRENWKKRFTNLKTASDNTTFTLRRENAAAQVTVADLQDENARLRRENAELKEYKETAEV